MKTLRPRPPQPTFPMKVPDDSRKIYDWLRLQTEAPNRQLLMGDIAEFLSQPDELARLRTFVQNRS
jgi:hypothetical protein